MSSIGTPLGRALADAHRGLAKRVGADRALVISLAIGGSIAVATTYLATRIYDSVADDTGIEALDRPILHRAMRLRAPVPDAVAAGIARAFGPVGMPVLALTAATAMAIHRRSKTPVILVAAASAGSLALTLTGKDLIHRHRPPHRDAIPPYESSPSFPSGHTLNATTVVGVVAYLLASRQKSDAAKAVTIGAAVATAATVGLSRVLLGAHWFSDVLMGWASGSGWLALVITSHRLHLDVAGSDPTSTP
jgi:membrane-associated phospholipid phosphatase